MFGRRAAATGKLFGSVTTQEIADELLKQTGIDINRRRISQQQIREIGTHEVPVRLGNETSPMLKITVVREDELVEFLAKREAAKKKAEQVAQAEETSSLADDMTEVLPLTVVRQMVEEATTTEE